jgi:serine/threonine protein kinase
MYKDAIEYLKKTNKKEFVVDNVRIFRCVDPQKNNQDQFYFSEKELGKGGFASVYLGYPIDTATGKVDKTKRVALKTLAKDIPIQSVSEEASITNDYYETTGPFELENSHLIVTEYHSGYQVCDYFTKSNTELSTAFKNLNFDELIEAIWQLVLQLYLMHHKTPTTGSSIVHADVKLDNIILELNNIFQSSPRIKNIKLLDFGCALPISSELDKIQHEARGTLLYMAPEVFCGEYSPASDVYSLLPIILIFLGALTPFFDRKKAQAIFDELFALKPEECKGKINPLHFKYNFDRLLANIKLPNPNFKTYIPLFLQRMQEFSYQDRPNIAEVLRFFTLLRNYIKQYKENPSSPELVVYEAKLIILAKGWWNTEIGKRKIDLYSYQENPKDPENPDNKFSPVLFSTTGQDGKKHEKPLQVRVKGKDETQVKTCMKANHGKKQQQTFEHYELDENTAKVIIELSQQSKLDEALLKKVIQDEHFSAILLRLLQHNLLTELMIDALDNDSALCDKVYSIESAEVTYLIISKKYYHVAKAWEAFTPEQALLFYQEIDAYEKELKLYGIEYTKPKLQDYILNKIGLPNFIYLKTERLEQLKEWSSENKFILYQFAVKYGDVLKDKMLESEYQQIKEELIDSVLEKTDLLKFFILDQNQRQDYLKSLERGEKLRLYYEMSQYEQVLQDKFELEVYQSIRNELVDSILENTDYPKFFIPDQKQRQDYLESLEQNKKHTLYENMIIYEDVLKEKCELNGIKYQPLRNELIDDIVKDLKYSTFYNPHQHERCRFLRTLPHDKKLELRAKMIFFKEILKEKFGDQNFQSMKSELNDSILKRARYSQFFNLTESQRQECLKKISQEKKLILHGEIVKFEEIIKEKLGGEKYQQMREQLSDSILETISQYNKSKQPLATTNPDDYERFGFFSKHKTNKAKFDANTKAKELLENYLKGISKDNPNEFFKQVENKEMFKSLQEGKSKDNTAPLFAYVEKLAAPAA